MKEKVNITNLCLYDVELHLDNGSCTGGIEVAAHPVMAAKDLITKLEDKDKK